MIFLALLSGAIIIAGILTRVPHTGLSLAHTVQPSPAPSITASPTSAPTPSPTTVPGQPSVAGASIQPSASPHTANTPKPAPAAPPIATPTPAPTVNLTITSPAGSSAFTVLLIPGADACAVLEEAHTEGKLTLLDIDYSTVKSSLHSAYVRQINSYANGWTFKVNGVSPEGCSLSHPSSNDQIIWRYE